MSSSNFSKVLSVDEAKRLLRHCETGRLYEIERWINSGKSILVPPEVKKTPLEVALKKGFHSLVELLLRNEDEQEAKNRALEQAVSQRRLATGLIGIAGSLLVGFGMLVIWWVQSATIPQAALWLLQGAVTLMGVRTFYLMLHLFRASPLQELDREPLWPKGAVVSFLGLLVLVGGLGFRPLTPHLMEAQGIHLPEIPTGFSLLRYIMLSPAVWGTVIVAIALREFSRQTIRVDVDNLEGSSRPIVRVWSAIRSVVEADALDRAVRLSQRLLKGARILSRVVEQDGLEGLLRAVAGAVKQFGQYLQIWHTGRLRYNLFWVLLTLVLALSVVIWVG